MTLKILRAAALALICATGIAAADSLNGEKTYDLLFRGGTLDKIDRADELLYRREVLNTLKPEAGTRDTGTIALGFTENQATMATMEFRRDGKHRRLGEFPATVGNPMIMYFYESVVRDMSEAAGGSPFYIRNRVKESLVTPSEVETGTAQIDGNSVETQTIRLRPFADDPNQARMQGFGDLELRVTMSEAVPGWYLSLVAEAGDGKVYRSEVTFEKVEDGL